MTVYLRPRKKEAGRHIGEVVNDLVEDEEGQYVSREQYDSLLKENNELKSDLTMDNVLLKLLSIIDDQGLAPHNKLVIQILTSTFLNNVNAIKSMKINGTRNSV